MSRDHFYPRSKGGKNKANMVLACRRCNSEKSSQTIYEFREYNCRKLAEYLRLPHIKDAQKLQLGSLRIIEKRSNIIIRCTALIKHPDVYLGTLLPPYTALQEALIKAGLITSPKIKKCNATLTVPKPSANL